MEKPVNKVYEVTEEKLNDDKFIIRVKDIYIAFHMVTSPFNNCQLYSIGSAASLGNSPDIDCTKAILKKIMSMTGKKMLIIDLRREKVNNVLKFIKPLSLKIQKMNYINSNNSLMTICMIKLDAVKISK